MDADEEVIHALFGAVVEGLLDQLIQRGEHEGKEVEAEEAQCIPRRFTVSKLV